MSSYSDKYISSYLELPAIVYGGGLKSGNVHHIKVNESKVDISTYPGLYGSQERRTLLTVRHSNVLEAKYAPPILMALTGYCEIRSMLFGSKARGDSGPTSDIDILIITDRDDWRLSHAISDIAADVSLEYNVIIGPRVIGTIVGSA